MKTVYIEYSSYAYRAMFESMGFQVVYSPEGANLICFTGGADVTPSYYKAARHEHTQSDMYRDEKEKRLFEYAQKHEIPCVGICRGGQFLNVMSGGEMYQHIKNHGGSHYLVDLWSGETIFVSSTHHQMMKPAAGAVIVATSNLRGEREWYEGQVFKKDVSQEDIEVLYYSDTQSLCFQPHPEFNDPEYKRMREYFGELINKFLGV